VLHQLRGRARFADGDAAAALVSFEDAASFAQEYGTADQRFATQWAVARALRELGRVEEAMRLQSTLAAERPDEPAVREELEQLAAAVQRTASEETPTIES
jgi:HAMP domain-containing protein